MSDTQLIKDKIDVADLIGEYVQLKPSGINKKGLCPFHHEKSPSFMVNSERQSWHCFGCGKGGDIFSFVQEMEGMEFVEALKYLANRAGVPIDTYKSEVNTSQKNRLKELNREATRFFHSFLMKMPTAKVAMDYLLKRGLKIETIDEWQVGFIPEQWDLLTQYLLKKGFSIDDLVASGLTIKKDGSDIRSGKGFYDRFRGRIMFPIWDVHGDVAGFTGRILIEKENSGGKYVNTPQTIIFDKSRLIFGLNKAKQEIKAKDLAVIVEGQMDVIACHQAGMKNVVASSGTALTEEQIKLLKRYSNNLKAAFDVDEAGLNAGERGSNLASQKKYGEEIRNVGGILFADPFIQEGMNVKVIRIPENSGKDPDECIKLNPSVWFKAVEGALGVMEWYFDRYLVGEYKTDPKQKQKIANKLLQKISLIPFAVEKDHWLRELSGRLNVDVSVLREDLSLIKNLKSEIKNNEESTSIESNKSQITNEKTRLDILLESLLALCLKLPEILKMHWLEIPGEILSTSRYAVLYKELERQYNSQELLNIEKISELKMIDHGENLVDLLLMKGELQFSDLSEKEVEKEFSNSLALVNENWLKNKRKNLQIKIEMAEKNKDGEELKRLMEEYNVLK